MVVVDPGQRQLVAELVASRGAAEAARHTGLGRLAVMGIVARGTTTTANAALLALRLAGERPMAAAPFAGAPAMLRGTGRPLL